MSFTVLTLFPNSSTVKETKGINSKTEQGIDYFPNPKLWALPETTIPFLTIDNPMKPLQQQSHFSQKITR